MKKLKQCLYQKRNFFVFIGQILLFLETIKQINTRILSEASPELFDFFIVFMCLFITLSLTALIFLFTSSPYKERVLEKVESKDLDIELPKLYSFADTFEFSISISRDKNINSLLAKKDDPLSFLSIEKLDIKVLSKDLKEIDLNLSQSISKTSNIIIELKNKRDLEKVHTLSIKSEKDIEFFVDFISYNRKV